MSEFIIILIMVTCVIVKSAHKDIRNEEWIEVDNKSCIHRLNTGFREVQLSGMTRCILDLIRLWKWRRVLVFHIEPLRSLDIKTIVAKVANRMATAWSFVHCTANEDIFIRNIHHAIHHHESFVIHGSSEATMEFMQLVTNYGLLKSHHIWIMAIENPVDDPKEMLKLQRVHYIDAQIAIIAFDFRDSRKPLACRNIVLYDLFYPVDNYSDMQLIEFGEWTFRHGLIILEALATNSDQYSLGLRRKLVRATTFEFKPYSFVMNRTSSTELSFYGYLTDVVKIMSLHLNSRLSIQLSKSISPGTLNKKQNNYSGVLGEIYERKADIGINILVITWSRNDGATFTFPMTRVSMGLWLQSRGRIVSKLAHVSTFTYSVWIVGGIMASILFACFTFSEVLYYWKIQTAQLFQSILKLGELCPNRFSSRLFIGTLLLLCLLLSAHYNSVLMSFLTYSKSSRPFNNLEQLLKLESFKLTAVAQANYYDVFVNSKQGIMKKVWHKILRDKSILVGNTTEGLDAVCARQDIVFLMDMLSPMYEARNRSDGCQLDSIVTRYMTDFGCLPLRTDFPFQRIFFIVTLRMSEYGIVNREFRKYFKREPINKGIRSKHLRLDLSHFGFPIIVICVGIFCSLCALAIELIMDNYIIRISRQD